MQIRKYRRPDILAISRLYYETVRNINSKDYSNKQIEAWAPHVYRESFWKQRFRQYDVYVAADGGFIAGFADFDKTGHIDCFYVHYLWQGKGVGTKLLKRIEADARKHKIKLLFADISITAKPFFKKAGFSVVRQQKKIYRNCSFRQYLMQKRL